MKIEELSSSNGKMKGKLFVADVSARLRYNTIDRNEHTGSNTNERKYPIHLQQYQR